MVAAWSAEVIQVNGTKIGRVLRITVIKFYKIKTFWITNRDLRRVLFPLYSTEQMATRGDQHVSIDVFWEHRALVLQDDIQCLLIFFSQNSLH